ncbi:hypothetical protein KEM52_004976, partial [Ascosphaera acerosa]
SSKNLRLASLRSDTAWSPSLSLSLSSSSPRPCRASAADIAAGAGSEFRISSGSRAGSDGLKVASAVVEPWNVELL